MKSRLKPLLAALALTSLLSSPTMAAVTSEEVQDLSAQAAELKKTLASLQKQVNALDSQVERKKHAVKKNRQSTDSHADNNVQQDRSRDNENSVKSLTAKQLRNLIVEEREYLPFDMDVPGQAFVSTGPYVGVPFQFAGSDLVVNSPSIDIDVQLLGIRKSITQQLKAMGGEIVKEPYHSHLLLSGVVEANANYTNIGGSPSTTDIDVSNVSLDAFILGPSEWMLGFIEFTYVNVTPATDVFGGTSQYRVSDSRLLVNKAFVTLGNFSESPFYSSFGQFYVPFGVYSSVMVSTPLTTILTRTKGRSILLGFQQQDPTSAFFGSAYIFRGDSHSASVAKVNNGGITLGYKFKGDYLKGKIGAGVIGNIADSGGMQTLGNFQNAEQIVHRVPGYNVRGILSVGTHLDLIGEYVGASTRFNPNDMSYNGHGAKPYAFDLEAAFNTDFFYQKPSSLAVGYAESQQALALGLPLNRVSLVLNTSWWRNTLQSLEIRRDREYAASNTASGGGGVATPAASGKIDKSITAQFDYYF